MNRFDAEVRWREGGYRLGKIAGQNLNEALARREAYAPARVTAFAHAGCARCGMGALTLSSSVASVVENPNPARRRTEQ